MHDRPERARWLLPLRQPGDLSERAPLSRDDAGGSTRGVGRRGAGSLAVRVLFAAMLFVGLGAVFGAAELVARRLNPGGFLMLKDPGSSSACSARREATSRC